ncbi:MAG TPA: tetratricopeptide repeat protein [Terriglobia bacterium]|nr:tetratricopeptide repeat protein [Terriglobia bacterium]
MEAVQFIFWEAIKALALAVLGLLAIKAASGLRLKTLARAGLYALVLALAALGARGLGLDIAAEVAYWTSIRSLNRSDVPQAYLSALRAVERRPANLHYWQALARAKLSGRQFQSLVEDQPAFLQLARGPLDEDDLLRFALCRYSLQQYGQVIPMTQELIRASPVYTEPYVLEGLTYTALKKYPQAEKDFLNALQLYPSQADAVEGLAQVYFLTGETGKARAVLEATAKYPFPPKARKRFAALEDLYGQ